MSVWEAANLLMRAEWGHRRWPGRRVAVGVRLRMMTLGGVRAQASSLPRPSVWASGGLSWALPWSGSIILSAWTNQPGSCDSTLAAIFSVAAVPKARVPLSLYCAPQPQLNLFSVLTVWGGGCTPQAVPININVPAQLKLLPVWNGSIYCLQNDVDKKAARRQPAKSLPIYKDADTFVPYSKGNKNKASISVTAHHSDTRQKQRLQGRDWCCWPA